VITTGDPVIVVARDIGLPFRGGASRDRVVRSRTTDRWYGCVPPGSSRAGASRLDPFGIKILPGAANGSAVYSLYVIGGMMALSYAFWEFFLGREYQGG
jgi:hypothetical protein